MWLLRAWLNREIGTAPRLAEILFSCATCGNCVEHCVFPQFKGDLLNAIIAGREELVERGAVPPGVRDFFKAVQSYGNPYKLPAAERGMWAQGLGLETYGGQEYLLYVDCVGAYDERGRRIARAAAGLLKRAGVSFGIAGADVQCDGNEVKAMGEAGLFERLARENIARFQAAGVRKVVVISPHAYHTLKNDYPALGGDFDVFHYTRILEQLMRKIPPDPDPGLLRLTFHDPCYLGRHNGEYSAPRKVLRALPGVQLQEMDRCRADSLCCGGGGGNFFTDLLKTGPDTPARTRVREAASMGVEVIATACPQCTKMLEDAAKAEFADERLRVMDIAEIVLERSHLSFRSK
jgi:Fe-S oxidoreductase